MMKIKISESIDFFQGLSKEDEEAGYFDISPLPMLVFSGDMCAYLIFNEDNYVSFTEELFWYLVSKNKLKCPRCNSELDFDFHKGDSTVGMSSYRLCGCVNEKCYYTGIKMDSQREQELIREIFPLYWRWNKSKEE